MPIIGIARVGWLLDKLRARALDSLQVTSEGWHNPKPERTPPC